MRRGSFLFVLVSILLYSCSPATSVPTPAPTGGSYPLSTTTGIQDVDHVLEAVAGGDPGQVASLIRYTTAPCTKADGLGGPPKCRDGEADGTVLDVLPLISSEGSSWRKDESGKWSGIQQDALYAIYRVSLNALNEQFYPAGDYMIVFTPGENGDITVLHVAHGGIVRVDTLHADSLKAIITRDASEVILPPKTR
jgi:hypothetical protein